MKLKELFMTKALIDAMMYNELLFDDPLPQYYATIGVSLKINNTAVVGLKEFGDIGGEPSELDTTTLADSVKTSILGVQEQGKWTVGIYYSDVYADTIWALQDETPKTNKTLELTLPTGEKFTNSGMVAFKINGGSVDSVIEGSITVSLAGKWTRVPATP